MNIVPFIIAKDEGTAGAECRQFDLVMDMPPDRRSVGAMPTGAKRPSMLVGERAHRFHFLDLGAVDYLEVDGNYVIIHVGDERFLIRTTLKQLSANLAECDFVRIDRSCLVNLRRVAYVERSEGGQFAFVLRSGDRLLSSRERAARIVQLLKNSIR